MSKALPWSIKGVGFDARAAAKSAARQAGMTIGEWLNSVIAEHARDMGLRTEDIDHEGQLDAVAARLAGMSEEGRWARSAPARETRRPTREAPAPSSLYEDMDGQEEEFVPRRQRRVAGVGRGRFDAHEASYDTAPRPARHSMREAPRDLESWLEEGDPALERLDRKLSDLAARLGGGGSEARQPDVARLESRLDHMLERTASASGRGRPFPSAGAGAGVAGAQRRSVVQDAIAEIEAHQRNLDYSLPLVVSQSYGRSVPGSAPVGGGELGAVRADISALASRLDRMRDDLKSELASRGLSQAARGGPGHASFADEADPSTHDPNPLRQEIDALTEALADIAPREDVTHIAQSVRDLSARTDAARRGGVAAHLLAPVEALADDVKDALANLARRPITDQLARELRRISAKVDGLSPGAMDPHQLQGLLAQIAEIHQLVDETATRPLPAELISSQLQELNKRMQRFADTRGRSGSFEVDLGVRGVRAALEHVPADGLVHVLEERMNSFRSKIEQLVIRDQRQAAGGSRAHSSDRPDTGGLETLMRDIAHKLDKPSQSQPNLAALERLMGELARKLERPNALPPGGLLAIDGLMREVAQKLDHAAVGPIEQVRALQNTVNALAGRLDQANAHGDPARFDALQDQIAQLAARIDQANGGGSAMASLQRSVEELFNHLETTRASALQAAEQAARTAARDALREAGAGHTLEAQASVTQELMKLRATQDAADARVHATLESVHQTLAKVAARLGAMDTALDARDAVPLPPIDPQAARGEPGLATPSLLEPSLDVGPLASGPAPMFSSPPMFERQFSETPAPKRQSFEPQAPARRSEPEYRSLPLSPAKVAPHVEPSFGSDFLIEPGSGQAPQRAPVEDDAGPSVGFGAHHGATQADVALPESASFIAAARRAVHNNAQVGSAEAWGGDTGRPAMGMAETGRGRTSPRMPQAGNKPRMSTTRKIVYAVATILLMLCSAQVLRMMDAEPVVAPNPAQGVAPARPGSNASTPSSKNGGAPTAPQKGADLSPIAPDRTSISPKLSVSALNPPAEPTRLDPMPSGMIPSPSDLASANLPAMTQGLKALQEAVARNNRLAQYELGQRYTEGRGVPRDLLVAAQWFEKAAAQELAPAQYRLASMYEKGFGVARDVNIARKWYRRAAEGGNVRAMHNLAVLTADVGADGKPDYTNAAIWFRKAAEFGVRDSQFNLAILYARGMGVEQSLLQSYVWFAIGAAQGDADALKRRDDVAARMDARQLSDAKSMVEQYRPRTPDPLANDVQATPAWDVATPVVDVSTPAPASLPAPVKPGPAPLKPAPPRRA